MDTDKRISFPERGSDEIDLQVFHQSPNNTTSQPDPSGVAMTHGWTVGIDADGIRRYLSNYVRNPLAGASGGFHRDGDRFIISHAGAKIHVRPEVGEEIIKFLSGHFSKQ